MWELSVSEQRYQAVLAVIKDGETVVSVAARFGVSRKTVHQWLARYEAGGLEGLADRSHRPRSSPLQMPAVVEVALVDLRRRHPSWGPRRLVYELARAGVEPVPSESGAYRALLRFGLIDPAARRPRDRKWKRWERGLAMELWQMDVVGGFLLADGRRAKALTGIDDHSRFCVSAFLMLRENAGSVAEGLRLALERYGLPGQVLTDNGKVFTGRFNQPPVEMLFDRILREYGVEHLLTQPRSPTTTGKVERFHRALRTEFRTDRVFASLAIAQAELDTWVEDYNHHRPHQAIGMVPPATRFLAAATEPLPIRPTVDTARPAAARGDGDWVARRANAVGVITVNWQQIVLGKAAAGRDVDVWVTDEVVQVYDGDQLLRTQLRRGSGQVRKKRSSIPGGRSTVKTSGTHHPE
ncbi:MAG TPA: IS481 family transposase [Agromyces sp.]